MPSHFRPEALDFLRSLGRHNERDWFNARKQVYEDELKAPLLALIAEINEQLLRFAPDHVRPPQKAMMRLYRDIRFSKNKAPYKTNVSAWWSPSTLEKDAAAGFYFSVSPSGVVVAAGAYEPGKTQLHAIRTYLVEHSTELADVLSSRKLKTLLPGFEGRPLTRPPKGFAATPPEAMPWILCRQWAVHTTLPADTALSPSLPKEIASRFRAAAPFVALLNTPLQPKPRKPLF